MTTSRKPSAVCRGACLPTRAVLSRTRSAWMLRGMLGLPPARPRRAGARPAQAAQAAPAAAAAAAGLAPVCEEFRARSVAALLTYQSWVLTDSATTWQRFLQFTQGHVASWCSTGLLPWSRTVQGHATCNSCCSSRLPWTVGRAALPLMASGSTRARTTTSGKDGAATCCSSPATGACFNVWAEKLLSSC